MNDMSQTPTPKRRGWSYSLLSLLCGVTLASVALGWVSYEVRMFRREYRAATLLASKYDAYVSTASDNKGSSEDLPYWDLNRVTHGRMYCPVDTISVVEERLGQDAEDALRSCPRLQKLRVQDCRLDSRCRAFTHLRSVTHLDVSGTPLTLSDVSDIGRLVQLNELNLAIPAEQSIELPREFFAQLKGLSTLYLDNIDLSDDAMAAIGELDNLRSLIFSNCRIAQESIVRLSRLNKIDTFGLISMDLDDGALIILQNYPLLDWLSVDNCAVTDGGLDLICRKENLWQLSLCGTSITDDGIPFLMKLPKIRALHIKGTSVTSRSIPVLRQIKSLDWSISGFDLELRQDSKRIAP